MSFLALLYRQDMPRYVGCREEITKRHRCESPPRRDGQIACKHLRDRTTIPVTSDVINVVVSIIGNQENVHLGVIAECRCKFVNSLGTTRKMLVRWNG